MEAQSKSRPPKSKLPKSKPPTHLESKRKHRGQDKDKNGHKEVRNNVSYTLWLMNKMSVLKRTDKRRYIYVVSSEPLEPYKLYDKHSAEFRDGYHPIELWTLDQAFSTREAADLYCASMNTQLYIDNYGSDKLTEAERKEVKDAVTTTVSSAPAEERNNVARLAYLTEMSKRLLPKLGGYTFEEIVDRTGGGYSVHEVSLST